MHLSSKADAVLSWSSSAYLECAAEGGDLLLLQLTRVAVGDELLVQALLQRRELLPLLAHLPCLVQDDLPHAKRPVHKSVGHGFWCRRQGWLWP